MADLKKTVAETFALLAGVLPFPPPDREAGVKVWYLLAEQMDATPEEVKAAGMKLLLGERFPVPGAFVKTIRGARYAEPQVVGIIEPSVTCPALKERKPRSLPQTRSGMRRAGDFDE